MICYKLEWRQADHSAQLVVSLPDFSLPAAADLPGVVDKQSSLLKLLLTPTPKVLSVKGVLVATFGGVCA